MTVASSPPVASTLAPPRVRARRSHALYLGASALFAAIAFVGFIPTYWAPIAAGTVDLHPAIHVHAWLYFLWAVFYVAQTALVARGRTAWHRELGLFGIALASAMVFAGVLAAIVGLQSTLPVRPEFARTSLTLSLSSMVLFTTFVTLFDCQHPTARAAQAAHSACRTRRIAGAVGAAHQTRNGVPPVATCADRNRPDRRALPCNRAVRSS